MKPNADIWNPLLDQMKILHELKPWEWLSDRDVFGVHDPASDTVGYVCVLGAGGEISGLAVYPGAEGWSFLGRMLEGELDELDGAYSQEAVTAFLYDRKELRPDAHKLLRSLRRSYRGHGAWPEVSRHRYGLVPVVPDDADASFMLAVIGEAIDVCRRAHENPRLISPREKLLVRRDGRDTRETPPLPPDPPPFVPFDAITLKRLAKMPRIDQTWVGDHFITPKVIGEKKQPAYFGRGHVWVDGRLGTILDMDIAKPDTGDEHLRARFVDLADKLGLPAKVVLRRESLVDAFRALEPHVEVTHDDDPSFFQHLREQLMSFGGRR